MGPSIHEEFWSPLVSWKTFLACDFCKKVISLYIPAKAPGSAGEIPIFTKFPVFEESFETVMINYWFVSTSRKNQLSILTILSILVINKCLERYHRVIPLDSPHWWHSLKLSDLYCLVPRLHYSERLTRFGSRGPHRMAKFCGGEHFLGELGR